QRVLHAGNLPDAARVGARHVEPPGAPPARRLRVRAHALQLHLHRRQPTRLGGHDGQRSSLETSLPANLLGPGADGVV
nr:hypothetical protein [Tanacetum cinerariifolium]